MDSFPRNIIMIPILVIFKGIESEFEKIGPTLSRFNPCPSLASTATDNRKQFHCLI